MSDMAFRAEVNIPVTKEPRMFEQRRNNMMPNLENNHQRSSSRTSDFDDFDKTTISAMKTGSYTPGDRWLSEPSWSHRPSRWFDEARKNFNMDTQNLKNNIFSLEPVDNFGKSSWDNFDDMNSFRVNNSSSMMEQMQRRMDEMRRQMDTSLRISDGNMKSNMPTSHRSTSHFSTSSSRIVNDGGIVKKSESSSSASRQNIDGVVTGTQSESKSENVGKLGSGLIDLRSDGNGIEKSPMHSLSIPNSTNYFSDAYEVGDDGLVHFKVRFDAKDFSPEDIDVNTVGNRLTVCAKNSKMSTESSSSREFSRTIDLPRSIDHDKFKCSLTEDGVLILDAPVKAPDYASITYDSGNQLGIHPKDSSLISEIDSRGSINETLCPKIVVDGSGGRKLHLKMPIEDGYTSRDICVRMEGNRIFVSGKRDIMTDRSHGNLSSRSEFQSSQSEEFSRSFEVPESVEPFSISAVLKNNILTIEAPLNSHF